MKNLKRLMTVCAFAALFGMSTDIKALRPCLVTEVAQVAKPEATKDTPTKQESETLTVEQAKAKYLEAVEKKIELSRQASANIDWTNLKKIIVEKNENFRAKLDASEKELRNIFWEKIKIDLEEDLFGIVASSNMLLNKLEEQNSAIKQKIFSALNKCEDKFFLNLSLCARSFTEYGAFCYIEAIKREADKYHQNVSNAIKGLRFNRCDL